jgi:hypothetical protein
MSAPSSGLKNKYDEEGTMACSSETSADFHRNTRRHIAEDFLL